jgi:beta-lactamase regulating signal transducer with metallopeptidase domain
MAHDLIELVARANLVLAAAIVFVFLLRAPVRDWFGARVAYALWLIPPVAASMCFLPPRTLIVSTPALSPEPSTGLDAFSFAAPAAPLLPYSPTPLLASFDPQLALAAIWIGVALIWLVVLALRQRRFVASLGELAERNDLGRGVFTAQAKGQGPALIGLLQPRIVTPADFDERYTEEERAIMLAHERAHLRQGDPLVNAAAAFLQCLCWFNPFVHAGIRALRIDQELACDAFVLASSRAPRRSYAQALIKTHIAREPAPLGCAWPPVSLDAMKERIAMLKRNLPSRTQTLLGASAIALVGVFACAAAWSAQPPNVVAAQARAERDAHADKSAAHARDETVRIIEVDDANDVDVDTDEDDHHDADANVHVNPDPDVDIHIEIDDDDVALLGADGKPDRQALREAVRRARIDAERVGRAARLTDEERARIRQSSERIREISRRAARDRGLTEQERAQIAQESARVGEIARVAAERAQLSQEERARIAREVARVRVITRDEFARARAGAQAAVRVEAHAAAREARAHADGAHPRAHNAEAAAIRREARTLAARAMELAALSVDDDADEAARERAEAALEASAERIAELVARVRAEEESD